MFDWGLAKKLFDGFMILRWTDFIRPMEYTQIEKSATQAVLSYLIGKEYEERTGKELDWEFIVRSNIFGLLSKIATSDIKATINNKIKAEHAEALKEYILGIYFDENDAFRYRPQNIVTKDDLANFIDKNDIGGRIEYEICYAAHKFATYREFCYIENLNLCSPDTEIVKKEICPATFINKIKDNTVKEIIKKLDNPKDELFLFFSYFEKLKPQIRWSQTCRLPQTTVLGHSMYVAVLTYFAAKEMQIVSDESTVVVNSFFAALFHDLPESLTRDIISPVKRSIRQFESKLAEYEYQQVCEMMGSRIPDRTWKKHFMLLLGEDNQKFLPFDDREGVLGELVETMDKIAAFIEAKMSIELGVSSDGLKSGVTSGANFIMGKVFDFRYNRDWKKSKKPLYLNDFLASIPH